MNIATFHPARRGVPAARRPHRLPPSRAARTIERRRTPARAITEPAVPVAPVMRFDDEPMFVGSHLEAQLLQRQWRWW